MFYLYTLQPLTRIPTAYILLVRKFWLMSNGEGRSEAGNPAVLVVAWVVVLNDSSQRQPPHLRGGASEVVLVGVAEVSAIEEEVALEVAVGDSALAAEASVATEVVLEVATAMVMIGEDIVIEVDLAVIGEVAVVSVVGSMVVKVV